MEFRTPVDIATPPFAIHPSDELLFVGSCFADGIGRRFVEERFRATVNPYGVMYNPVSVLHTVERFLCNNPQAQPTIALFTLGTNHVYRLNATGEIVDNCQKRPASLFTEQQLSVDECVKALQQAIALLRQRQPQVGIMLTVSPIRYRKYGYHGSQLSKATLLLAVETLLRQYAATVPDDFAIGGAAATVPDGFAVGEAAPPLYYFPAYEIVLDELRDYRFFAADMLHPTQQAVDYIWERLADSCLAQEARQMMADWKPLKAALAHRPLNPDSDEYRRFEEQTRQRLEAFNRKYPYTPLPPSVLATTSRQQSVSAGFPR